MTPLWTSKDAERATGGRSTRAWQATGVSIDTRTICKGDLFVALSDARDGHDFVAQALEKGASAALVNRVPKGVGPEAPLLIVEDVLGGLEAMGRYARARTAARVIGVTGSVGKTSTKEMLRAVLGGQGKVHAAEKSFNNHWGVPLTLARMPADADYAVIEIGMNHPGEISPLAKMACPHVALITTVAPAHMHAFDDLAGIAREKAAIFDGLERDGIAVINGDLPVTGLLVEKAREKLARPILFGQSSNVDYRLDRIQIIDDTTVVYAAHEKKKILFKVMTAGRHFAMNALGCLAVADAVGADLAVASCDLTKWRAPAGRGARETIILDVVEDHLKFELLDDAYNANPASLAAAIEVLAASKATDGVGRVVSGRKIAILGDMLELGKNELDMHRAVKDYTGMDQIDIVHCVGERMKSLYEVLAPAARGRWFATASEMSAYVHAAVDAGDVVLVKGSLGIKIGQVVDTLRKLGHPQNPEEKGTD